MRYQIMRRNTPSPDVDVTASIHRHPTLTVLDIPPAIGGIT
jgi:hypothetical protein